MITINVDGPPVGQGALRSNGRTMYESTKGHKPWRQAVIYEARDAWGGADPWLGPVGITVVFTFPYRQSDLDSKGMPKVSAPTYKITAPDTDHLQRSIGDALALAGCIRNDAQIAHWDAIKVYGMRSGAVIKIRALETREVI